MPRSMPMATSSSRWPAASLSPSAPSKPARKPRKVNMSSESTRATAPSQDVLADPIEMEVFSNRLLSITEDMNNTLVRASFSTNIKERKDCSVALFDAAGRLVAQGTQIPLHLGSLNGAIEAVL